MGFKRGQVSGQIFVYIAAIIIVSVVIFFGLRMFSHVSKTTQSFVSIDFQNQVRTDVNSLVGSFGSTDTKTYRLPDGFTEICFVDVNNVDLTEVKIYPLIKDSVESKSNNNVFLLGPNKFGGFHVDGISFTAFPSYACVNSTNNVVTVKYYSSGDGVSVRTGVYELICQNAEDKNLCNGLDTFFGEGYRNDCISKYQLCE